MNEFDAGSFSDISGTDLGRELWAYLNSDVATACLETTTYLGRPALEGLQPHLLAKFGDTVRVDRYKQMVGRMARQILKSRGYEHERSDVRVRVGDLFGVLSRYHKRGERPATEVA
ncbi:hypothetical protein CAQ69_04870 [Stutzerimonas stutzeri]|nr:hypothetical protein CAQ69_04870 [Stutzerimonas stutzeri]